MNLQFFKDHPYSSAAGAIALFVIIYMFTKSSSTSTAGTSTTDASGTDLQLLQLQSSNQQQANQLNAQTQVAALSASVQNNQTAAQLEATDNATAAQLAALQLQTQAATTQQQSNNDTQVKLTQIQADASTAMQNSNNNVLLTQLNSNAAVETTQLNDVLQGQENSNATQLSAIETQYGYISSTAALQAAIASQGLSDQTQVTLNGQNNYEDLANQVIAKAGQTYNSGGDLNSATSLLTSVLNGGNPSTAVAAIDGQNAVSSANSPAGLIKSIGTVAQPILAGLFA